jgi:hypothetical protein
MSLHPDFFWHIEDGDRLSTLRHKDGLSCFRDFPDYAGGMPPQVSCSDRSHCSLQLPNQPAVSVRQLLL